MVGILVRKDAIIFYEQSTTAQRSASILFIFMMNMCLCVNMKLHLLVVCAFTQLFIRVKSNPYVLMVPTAPMMGRVVTAACAPLAGLERTVKPISINVRVSRAKMEGHV